MLQWQQVQIYLLMLGEHMQYSQLQCCINAPADIAQQWELVRSFEMDDAGARSPFSVVLAEEMEWDSAFTALAILEYKKFMLLTSIFAERMVPSIDVDTV